MSWLKKIVSTFSAQNVEKTADALLEAIPTMECATAAPAPVAQMSSPPDGEPTDEGANTRQRRYFVKKGLFVDNEEEQAAARKAVEASEEIRDQRPVDLKTLFPKLSLR
jgi:hypothetical protein